MTRTCRTLCTICAVAAFNPLRAQFGAPAASGQMPRAQQLPISGRAASGAVVPVQAPAGAGGPTSVNTVNSSIQVQGAYQGSTANGSVSSQPLVLTLQDAIRRGLQYNLGAIGSANVASVTRAERLAAVAQMLPDIFGDARESIQKINLAAAGFRISAPIPGFAFPTVIGPFNNFDARANVNESISITSLRNWKSSREIAHSADLSVQDSRELVALAVAGTYLQITASAARIQTAKAELDTAMAVYQQAVDRNKSGLNARIDVNRSLVELQSQQQRLTSLNNEYEKQKIALDRLIGLPMAQAFTLADDVPYRESPVPNADDLIQRAFGSRADVLAAAAQQKAAELAKGAAVAEVLPSLDLHADYGVLGVTPSNQAHATYTAAASITVPIFRSGRNRADIQQAEAVLAQRKAEYEDAKGRAEQDVRVALLDLTAASDQVKVAESNRSLAKDTLDQARDRFRSGVADTIEVVQAQESVATAEQDYISALFAFNLAQVSLARAIGQTEQGIARLLQGK